MKKLLFLLTILPFALSAVSFDCDKAKTDIEKFICKDPKLSKLDDEMGKAYKQALDRATNKEALKKEQIAWIELRNKLFAISKLGPYEKAELYRRFPTTTEELYQHRLFYLTAKDDKFHIKYSADNQTCGYFAKILNDDLSKNGNVNLSRIKEFNWIEWKRVQDEGYTLRTGGAYAGDKYIAYRVDIAYFDINNDNITEAVFEQEFNLYGDILPDIIYMSKERGIELEKLNLRKSSTDKYLNADNVKKLREALLQANISLRRTFGVAMSRYFAYPFRYNNEYFLGVFGTIENRSEIRTINKIDIENYSNIVALVKYNPKNESNKVCVLTIANPNTKKYLRYIEP